MQRRTISGSSPSTPARSPPTPSTGPRSPRTRSTPTRSSTTRSPLFDLGQNSVNGPEITDGAVTSTELADNSVDASKIPNGSIRAIELDGGRSNGAITLNSGFVANGRCRDFGISVPGAEPGDAVLFSVNTDLPDGILLSGVRVIDDDVIQGKACNLTGGVFPQLNNIQVAILTFTL